MRNRLISLAGVIIITLIGCDHKGGDNPVSEKNKTVMPNITSFVPTSGPIGTSVALSGTGFTGTTSVTFDSTYTTFTVANDISITTTVPGGATTGSITVTTPEGTANSQQIFTVIPPFWKTQTSSTTNSLYGIVLSGAQFVAVGANGTVITSPDAVTWTSQFTSSSEPLFGVASSGNLFIAVGGSHAGTNSQDNLAQDLSILTSPDAKKWTILSCLTYLDCNPPSYSPVGIYDPTTDELRAVIWSGAHFVVTGTWFGSNIILTSTTGSAGSWKATSVGYGAQLANDNATLFALVGRGSQILAVGNSYQANPNPGALPVSEHIIGVSVLSLNNFDSTNTIYNSIGSYTLTGVAWSGTRFAAVGNNGVIYLSSDGINWQSQTSGTVANLCGIAWSGTEFIAVGQGGATLTSPDGINWTQQYSGTIKDINAIIWTGSKFVAVCSDGLVLISK